jgi:flagellar basal body rod protein FlgG
MNFKKLTVTFSLVLIFSSSPSFADNTFYVLAARQGDLQKTMNRIADMVANVNTTGFKSESDVYSELSRQMDRKENVSFGKIADTKRDYSQGALISTKRDLDVAINGSGYLMVETPRGVRYTRGGNLKIDSEGTLVTKEGFPLLGPGGGRVELTETDIDIVIRDNGLVSAGVEERGQIGVFEFEDEQALIKEGQGLYKTDQNATLSETSKIVQGMVEASNVNSVRAMTDLIEVSNNIEIVKKMQTDIHDIKINSIRTLTRQ